MPTLIFYFLSFLPFINIFIPNYFNVFYKIACNYHRLVTLVPAFVNISIK